MSAAYGAGLGMGSKIRFFSALFADTPVTGTVGLPICLRIMENFSWAFADVAFAVTVIVILVDGIICAQSAAVAAMPVTLVIEDPMGRLIMDMAGSGH